MGLSRTQPAPPATPQGLAPRHAAALRLSAVLSGSPFVPFGQRDLAEGRDRALANRLVTVALRRHGQIGAAMASLMDRGVPPRSGLFEPALRLALAQLLFLPDLGDHSAVYLGVELVRRDRRATHWSGLMNAVLRRAQADAERLRAIDPERNLPDWLRTRWRGQYGPAAVAAFADALTQTPPLDVTLLEQDPALIAALGATPVLADTVRLTSRDAPVEGLPGYAEGRWWVQDVAASLPARLIRLPRGARVLDLCAAPGGKTAQLVKAGYKVTALDSDPARIERLAGNLARLGYAVQLENQDARSYAPKDGFDAVLLDAPCTATGTFRRHPEAIWHRGPADLTARAQMQRTLLGNAVRCLNPGGVLVYATCSLEPEEGEHQIAWALAQGGVRVDPVAPQEAGGLAEAVTPEGTVRTHPGLTAPGPAGGTMDGFFAGRLVRI